MVLSLNINTNAQKISPSLFGQNHWIATGDEGDRIGYVNLLWPKVKESGVKCILAMNQDQNKDFGFVIILNNKGKSKNPLAITADASVDATFSGLIENQTSMLFVLDSNGNLKKQLTYWLKQNLKNQAPEVKEIK